MPDDYVKVSVEMVQSVIPAFTYARAYGIPMPEEVGKLAQSEYMQTKVGNEFRVARERAMISPDEMEQRIQHHKDAKLEKDLYSGVNKLELELRQPLSSGGAGADVAGGRNEAFLHRFMDEMNRFTKQFNYNNDPNDKEKRVQEFQRETLVDPDQGQAVTRTRIHFPNDGRLLGEGTHAAYRRNQQPTGAVALSRCATYAAAEGPQRYSAKPPGRGPARFESVEDGCSARHQTPYGD